MLGFTDYFIISLTRKKPVVNFKMEFDFQNSKKKNVDDNFTREHIFHDGNKILKHITSKIGKTNNNSSVYNFSWIRNFTRLYYSLFFLRRKYHVHHRHVKKKKKKKRIKIKNYSLAYSNGFFFALCLKEDHLLFIISLTRSNKRTRRLRLQQDRKKTRVI